MFRRCNDAQQHRRLHHLQRQRCRGRHDQATSASKCQCSTIYPGGASNPPERSRKATNACASLRMPYPRTAGTRYIASSHQGALPKHSYVLPVIEYVPGPLRECTAQVDTVQNSHQQVKTKILERMSEWAEMFAKDPDLGIMEDAYMRLKSQSM